MTDRRRILWACGVLLLCVIAAVAQDEEELARTLVEAPFNTIAVMTWLMYGTSYLIVYAAVLCITLSFCQLFPGFEGSTYIWILLLWVGGMVIATFSHIYIHNQPLAIIAAVPAIFVLSTILGRFNDLTWRDAARISLVTALLLAPYLTPPWLQSVRDMLPGLPSPM